MLTAAHVHQLRIQGWRSRWVTPGSFLNESSVLASHVREMLKISSSSPKKLIFRFKPQPVFYLSEH